MAQTVGSAVTRIIHDEGAVLHQFVDVLLCGRIGIARCALHPFIGVPVDALDAEVGSEACGLFNHGVAVLHVNIGVAVVAQHADGVFPAAHLLIIYIGKEFVHHILCLFDGGDRNATYADSRFCPQHIRGCVVVNQSEVVFQHIAFGVAQRVVRLVSGQYVVGADFAQSARHEAVIPVAVAKEQQILGLIVVAFGFVVKHLHETADGCGVRRTGREFVVNLVNRDD